MIFADDLYALRQANHDRPGRRRAAGFAGRRRGLAPGDVVLAIDGQKVGSFSDMQRIVSANAGRTLEFKIDRGGAPVTIMATPALKEGKDGFGNNYCHAVLGVSRSMTPDDVKTEKVNPLSAVWLGVLGDLVRHRPHVLLSDRRHCRAANAPISSAGRSGSHRFRGRSPPSAFAALMHLTAMLSVSIGLLNLFPVPLLDGGHLLFYGIEAVRGRPLSERAQEIGFRIGLAIVVMLMIFATFNDIIHLAAS